mgnify:FL=1
MEWKMIFWNNMKIVGRTAWIDLTGVGDFGLVKPKNTSPYTKRGQYQVKDKTTGNVNELSEILLVYERLLKHDLNRADLYIGVRLADHVDDKRLRCGSIDKKVYV